MEVPVRKRTSLIQVDRRRTSDGAAYLFDIRQSTSTLAIHLPIAATLLLLKLAVSATGLAPATMLREVPATSAAVVSSSRAPVQDLLIRKPDGSLALLTADGLEEGPPPLSAGCADGSAASLRSDGHSSVNVGDNGSMSRLPRRSEEARDLCLEVLAQVLPLDAFTRLRTDMAACDSSDEALQALASLLIGGTGGDTQPVDVRSSSSARLPGLPASDKGLRSLLRPGPAAARRRTGRAQPSPPGASRARVFETALFALHLLVQRLQLETAQRGNARAVSQLVLRLVTAAGFSAWIDYYARKYSLRASLSAGTS